MNQPPDSDERLLREAFRSQRRSDAADCPPVEAMMARAKQMPTIVPRYSWKMRTVAWGGASAVLVLCFFALRGLPLRDAPKADLAFVSNGGLFPQAEEKVWLESASPLAAADWASYPSEVFRPQHKRAPSLELFPSNQTTQFKQPSIL